MKKYHDEYYSVVDKRTGRKIVDCAGFSDAIMMVHMDPQTRQVVKNKLLMSQVIDVEIPKALPTNHIVVNTYTVNKNDDYCEDVKGLPQIKLPEGQEKPVIV
jgi:hypothetical protein